MSNLFRSIAMAIAIAFFLCGCVSEAFGQTPKILRIRIEPTFPDRKIRFEWTTNFAPRSQTVTATAERGSLSPVATPRTYQENVTGEIRVDPAGIKVEFGQITEMKFVTEFEWSTDFLNGTNVENLHFKIESRHADNMTIVEREHNIGSELITRILDLESITAKETPTRELPEFSSFTVVKITATTIIVQAQVDKKLSAQGYAYQTSNQSVVAETTEPDRKSDEVELRPGIIKQFKFVGLEPNKPYIIQLHETNPPPPAIRQKGKSDLLASDNNANPIRTKTAIPRPEISFRTAENKVQNILNQQVSTELNLKNTKLIEVRLFKKEGSTFVDTKINSKVSISAPWNGDNPGGAPYLLKTDFLLPDDPDKKFKLKILAYSDGDDDADVLSSETGESEEFGGVSKRLFNDLQIDLSGGKIVIRPTNVERTALKSEVVVSNGGRFPISIPCTDGTSAAPPECSVAIDATFFEKLETSQGSGPQAGNKDDLQQTEIATGEVRGILRIALTVKAIDGTQRVQSQTFEMAMTATKAPGNSLGRKFSNFVNSVVGNNNDNKLNPKDISGTGIGGFLVGLLRLFL